MRCLFFGLWSGMFTVPRRTPGGGGRMPLVWPIAAKREREERVCCWRRRRPPHRTEQGQLPTLLLPCRAAPGFGPARSEDEVATSWCTSPLHSKPTGGDSRASPDGSRIPRGEWSSGQGGQTIRAFFLEWGAGFSKGSQGRPGGLGGIRSGAA